MCGLVGMAGVIGYQHYNLFKDMLDVCQLRGRDSTGVIRVDDENEYTWIKQVGPPNVLYDTRQYENRIEKGASSALIGHTRSKTVGAISVKNAHPFDMPDEGVCGVHNGTLRNYTGLDGYTNSKVDSEVLYTHLATNGPEKTFNVLEGAFACVWWNDKEKTLNFFRNDERPLWFTWSKDLKTMLWASEIEMFWAVSRKMPLWDGGEAGNVYVEMPLRTLWSFRINAKATKDEKVLTLRNPLVIEAPAKKVVTVDYSRFQRGDWKKTGPNSYTRNANINAVKEGGEVPVPFPQKRQELDDKISDLLPPATQVETTNTHLHNVAFLRNSVKSGGLVKGRLNTVSVKRNILSLPKKHLSSSPLGNNGKPLNVLKDSKNDFSTEKKSILLKTGTSFRQVAGIEYVTDNSSGVEYSSADFFKNTGGCCTSCNHKFFGVDEVGAFLTPSAAMCTTCWETDSLSLSDVLFGSEPLKSGVKK
jgi:asparagine synthetase B (glutamine-hydrolysing)